MGNVMKKEDPLEQAKRVASRERAAKLKAKRRSTVREWDPSVMDHGQEGPSIINHGQEPDGWKANAQARQSLAPVKEWDPSGVEAPDLVVDPDHAVGWKAAVDLSADVGAKEKVLRRHSKRQSTVGLSGSGRASTAPGVGGGVGLGPPAGPPPQQRAQQRAPAETRLSLLKRASATDTGGGYDMSVVNTAPALTVVAEGPSSPEHGGGESASVAMV